MKPMKKLKPAAGLGLGLYKDGLFGPTLVQVVQELPGREPAQLYSCVTPRVALQLGLRAIRLGLAAWWISRRGRVKAKARDKALLAKPGPRQ
jgi:hypothetical protein